MLGGRPIVSAAAGTAASTVIELGSSVGGGDEEQQPMLGPHGRSTSSPTNETAGANSSLSAYLVNVSEAGFTRRRRHISSFYEQQNEIIQNLMEAEALHRTESGMAGGSAGVGGGDGSSPESEEEERKTQRALNLSFASNIALLVIRVAVALVSGSLSLLVTTLDAVLDVISGAIIWFTERSSRKRDKYRYPIGKQRMAPLGVVVFSTIMGTAGMSIIIEGINQLADGPAGNSDIVPLPYIIGSSLFVIIFKGFMYLLCRNSKNGAVQAFALDHLNDVVVNSAGLGGALLGQFVAWWTDPSVAIAMSLWLIWAWGKQAYENVVSLAGMSAPPSLLQKFTYVALHHEPDVVKQIDTVRAYSFGVDTWLVEVDVVLPHDMPLHKAHDVGEALQVKLERLPEVARAFVHLDYECSHSPGIEHKEL